MKKTFTLLLLWISLISTLLSCEREKVDAIDFTFQAAIQKAPETKSFYYVNQAYKGKLALNLDPRNDSKIETTFLTEGKGFLLIGEDKKKILPGESFIHDYRESALPIDVYFTSIGKNVIKFDFSSEHYNASISDSIFVKDLHYTISVDSLPERMLIGKKFSFRLNIEEKEKTDNEETTASGTITKGAGIMYVKDQVFINKPNDIVVTDPKDLIEGETKASTNNNISLLIGRNILTYLPQEDELNEINIKVNNPYNSSQTYSMSFNIEKPVFKTEAIVDNKVTPFVKKDYSFLLKVSQVDIYESNEYCLTYRFLKSNANLKVNAKNIQPGESLDIKEGENIIILNSEIQENCDIEFIVSDKFGSQYKDTANINFQALPMYSVAVQETEGGSVTGAGSYEESSIAKLIATPALGHMFVGYYTLDGKLLSSNLEYSFTVAEENIIKAVFKKNIYKIDAIAGEGGTVTGSGSYEFASNVPLNATPKNGYRFIGWFEGDRLVSGDANYSFQASASRTLIARFKLNKLSISVKESALECHAKETITFTISLDEENYTGTFKVYYKPISGQGTFSGTEEQVLAKGAHNMRYTPSAEGTHTLNFRAVDSNGQEENLNLTITALPPIKYAINATAGVGGTTKGSGEYEKEERVSLEAIPGNGYSFDYWQELNNKVSTANPYILEATKATTLMAVFKKNEITASVDKSSQDVKVGQEAPIFLSIEEANYEGLFTVKYELIAGQGTFSGGEEQTVGEGKHAMSFIPTSAGTHTYQLTITDQFGTNKVVNVTVTSTLSPIVLQPNMTSFNLGLNGEAEIQFNVSEVAYNDKFTLRYDLTGASGTFKVNNVELQSGLTTQINSGKTTLKFQIKQIGDANLKLSVSDTRGQTEIVNIKVNASGTITVSAGPGGTATGGGTFNELNSTANLSASANTGYTFAGWYEGGTKVSSDANYSFTVTSSRALEARFNINSYRLNVVANPAEGGSVSGSGTFPYGSQQTITASPNTAKYYVFEGWNDGNMSTSRTVTIGNSDVTYTAKFKAMPPVDQPVYLKTYGTGSGTVYINGSVLYDGAKFAPGTYTLTATPASDCSSSWTTQTITITDKPVNVEVTFTLEVYYTVHTQANGYGSVRGAGTYKAGTECTVTATAMDGSKFEHWVLEGEIVSTSNQYTFTVTQDVRLLAKFLTTGSTRPGTR